MITMKLTATLTTKIGKIATPVSPTRVESQNSDGTTRSKPTLEADVTNITSSSWVYCSCNCGTLRVNLLPFNPPVLRRLILQALSLFFTCFLRVFLRFQYFELEEHRSNKETCSDR